MFSSREWLPSFTEKTNRCIEVSAYSTNKTRLLLQENEEETTDESTERPAKQESILLYEKITDMLA